MTTYRMLVSLTGARNGVDWPRRGEVVDLPDSEAAAYVRAGFVAPVEVAEERATAPKPETATRKRAPRRKSDG